MVRTVGYFSDYLYRIILGVRISSDNIFGFLNILFKVL